VFKTAMPLHQPVQYLLSGVAERGMPQVMGQGQGLGQLLVQVELAGNGTTDLGHLKGVGQAVR